MLVQSYSRPAPAECVFDVAGEDPGVPSVSLSLTRRTSISEESQTSQNSRNFEHYREPTILDRPEVLLRIQEALEAGDAQVLANMVQEYGLPSYLRAEAWPILLRNHPSVIRARAEHEIRVSESLAINERSVKRLHGDLRRMESRRGTSLNFALIEHTVSRFLECWGDRIPYETPMIWVADFLITGQQSFGSPGVSPGNSVASSLSSSPSESNFAQSAIDPADTITPLGFHGISPDLLEEVFTNVMLVMVDQPAPFSEFISMIRTILPTLSEHFHCEGILSAASSGDVWLAWWLRWLGIRAFPSQLLERLWDEYFSFRPGCAELECAAGDDNDGDDNDDDDIMTPSTSSSADSLNSFITKESLTRCHSLNCITLMRVYMTKLLELDISECRQFLSHLPECQDVEAVIKESSTLGAQYAEPA